MTTCLFRGCSGELVEYDRRTQDGTGDRMYRYECTSNYRHQAWLIASLGVLHKETAGRWAKPQLHPEAKS